MVTSENDRPRIKMFRFAAVGAINTVFGYLVFAGLISLGSPDFLAVPLAMAVGMAFNFLSYGGLVFASLDARRLPRFIAAYLSLYGLNVLGLRVLMRLGVAVYGSQALLVFPLGVLAYLLNDRWVFRGVQSNVAR